MTVITALSALRSPLQQQQQQQYYHQFWDIPPSMEAFPGLSCALAPQNVLSLSSSGAAYPSFSSAAGLGGAALFGPNGGDGDDSSHGGGGGGSSNGGSGNSSLALHSLPPPFTLLVGSHDGYLRWFSLGAAPNGGGTAHGGSAGSSSGSGGLHRLNSAPRIEVRHHSDAITAVASIAALDTAVSASLDGTINVYSLRSGALRMTLHPVPLTTLTEEAVPHVEAAATATTAGGGGGGLSSPSSLMGSRANSSASNAGGSSLLPPPSSSLPLLASLALSRSISVETATATGLVNAGSSSISATGGQGGDPLSPSATSKLIFPRHHLYGAATASASSPGGCSALPEGRVIRPFTWAGVSQARVIVGYCACDSSLHAYSLSSGQPLCPPAFLPFTAAAFCWSSDGHRLLIGGDGGFLFVVSPFTLELELKVGLNGACVAPQASHPKTAAPLTTPLTVTMTSSGSDGLRIIGSSQASSSSSSSKKAGRSNKGGRRGGGEGGGGRTVASNNNEDLMNNGVGAMAMGTGMGMGEPAPFLETITSICLTEHEQALVLGFADGQVRVFTPEEAPVTAKMLSVFEERVGF